MINSLDAIQVHVRMHIRTTIMDLTCTVEVQNVLIAHDACCTYNLISTM